MALKIRFSNTKKTEVEYLIAEPHEGYANGANRSLLKVTCAADAIGVDALHKILCVEGNVATLTLLNEEAGVEKVHSGYVLELSCGIEKVQTAAETPEAPAEYADRLVFVLGKRTYIEEQLHALGLM